MSWASAWTYSSSPVAVMDTTLDAVRVSAPSGTNSTAIGCSVLSWTAPSTLSEDMMATSSAMMAASRVVPADPELTVVVTGFANTFAVAV